MSLRRVGVELGARRYDVTVGPGALRSLAGVLAAAVPSARRAAVVTHPALATQGWWADVDPGMAFDVHTLAEGETAKSLATVEHLCRSFAGAGLARSDVVVAVGGGVVTDTAGFAAAAYHRGTAWCAVATTLLAQVDAAIGGKTGVNLPEGKNLVGAFWQPSAVVCDTEVLRTLPEREWRCGRGEMAKYAFLGAPGLAALPVDEQVAACVAVKAAVVAGDERESGRRALLNYGHTLAHALEASAFGGGGLRHGEAVAIGLVFAAVLARRLGRVGDGRVAEHVALVEAMGLPGALPAGADPEALVGFMRRDKKAGHDLTFVLDGPGGLDVVRGVPEEAVLGALAELAAMAQGPAQVQGARR